MKDVVLQKASVRHIRARQVWAAVRWIVGIAVLLGAGCSFALAAMDVQVIHEVIAGLGSLAVGSSILRRAFRQRTPGKAS